MEGQKSEYRDEPDAAYGRIRRRLFALRPQDGQAARVRVTGIARGLLLGGIAYLLAATPLLFSVNPLAPALLCAATEQVGFLLAGTLLGFLKAGSSFPIYAGSCAIALFLRLISRLYLTPSSPVAPGDAALPPPLLRKLVFARYRERFLHLCSRGISIGGKSSSSPAEARPLPPLFDESVMLRALSALLSALLPGLLIPAQNGFAYYDLYGAVFYLSVCPIATYLFAGALQKRERGAEGLWYAAGMAALFFSVAFCGRSLRFLGLIPVVVLTASLSLFAVRRYGLIGGAVVSVLGGLAQSPATIPTYLLLSVLYALLQPGIGALALPPALLAALTYALLVNGTAAFWVLLPSLLAGVLIFCVLLRLRDARSPEANDAPGEVAAQNPLLGAYLAEQSRNAALSARLSAIAGSFSGLSEVFRQLGDCLCHPGLQELRELCDACFDRYCPDCPRRDRCWSDDYPDTLESVNGISAALAAGNAATAEDLSPALRERCPNAAVILADVNYRMNRRSFEQFYGARSELFSQSYDTVARLLRDILREGGKGENDVEQEELSGQVAEYLRASGISFRYVFVSGKVRRRVQILGISPAALTVPEEEFRRAIGERCGAVFPRMRYDGTDDGCLTLTARPPLRVDYTHASLAADDLPEQDGGTGKPREKKQSKRTVCGDSLRLFDGTDGMFYALLCDGMGSGRGAALTSGICAIFLERVLHTGVGIDTALRMLNQYLLTRTTSPEEECSSTVDLLAFDLFGGQAHFVKSGAAPSLVLRGGKLYRVAAHTVPIGILHTIDAQAIPFELLPGDHVLLMSDGIFEAPSDTASEEPRWLTDYLSGILPDDDNALIDTLFRMARQNGSRDDLSVISLRVSEET